MTFAITGASGQFARLAAERLLARVEPAQVVLITRNPGVLADFAARGVDVRAGDFTQLPTLEAAFAGVDRLLLVSTDAVGARLEPQVAAVRTAARVGVGHVLYTSVVRPEPGNPAGVTPDHAGTEQALRESGVGWTFLRNNLYGDLQLPALQQAAATGQLVTNAGDGRVAYVTRADCADAAVGALTRSGTENAVYDITGPAALSAGDLAALASRIGGREVSVVHVDDAAYAQGLVEHAGLPAPVAELLTSFGTATRRGYFDAVGTGVRDLTGHDAAPLADLVPA